MRFLSVFVFMALVATSMSSMVVLASADLQPGLQDDALLVRDEAAGHFHGRRSALMHNDGTHMGRRAADTQARCPPDQKKYRKKKGSKSKGKKKSSHKKVKSKAKSKAKAEPEEKPKEKHGHPGNRGQGLFGITFNGSQCKDPGATKSSPNGNIDFLNCGISRYSRESKWSPPALRLDQLRIISADQAAQSPVYKPCAKYAGAFNSASRQTGVPVALLMAFAMQESTCNPSTRGGNGEIGMMQLTPDKCTNKNCWDPATNVLTGAQYFDSQLKAFGGNVLLALGAYNGWHNGLTYSHATDMQYGCHAQNNLDYLDQMLNGWLQGTYGYERKKYNNLGKCK